MGKYWNYFLFLLWISYLIVAGILMFTRGFLLHRDAFPDASSCTPFNMIPCTPTKSTSINITNGHEYHCTQYEKLAQIIQDVSSASNLCFPKKSKVILMIIDALRYDFTTYDANLENPAPFQNNLPILHDLLAKTEQTRLYKFVADPPTTTMQRLKALTTGGLPTFIDAGSNFASSEVTEDNIINQLYRQNQSIVFMGDDTWNNLYPNRFTRSWPFPSFDVFDLDTVDYGIVKNLYSEIAKSDWNLLIAHFLGVDHCGHRYGPYHSEMKRKLTEINDIIKNVVNSMDNDTLLYIIGDHGMTNTGDHGGETDLEITSAFFIYSPTPLISLESKPVDSVKQVDLIPTLSFMLGVPIPFSNLGSIILDSIPQTKHHPLPNWQQALLALWANVEQITKYINRYSETSNQLSSEKLELMRIKYSKLKDFLKTVNDEERFKLFLKEAKEYILFIRKTCEDVWIVFDSFSMSRGLLIVFLTIFFAYMITDGIPSNKLSEILFSSFLLCSYIVVGLAIIVSIICYCLSIVESLELTIYFSTGIVSVFMLAIVVIQNWETIAMHWYECTKVRQWIDFVCRLIVVLFISILFSNSFILEEAKSLSFLLLGLVMFIIYNAISFKTNTKFNMKPKWNSFKTKLILLGIFTGLLIRCSMLFWRCRAEQNWCINFSFEDDIKIGKNSEKVQCIITLVFLSLLVTFSRIWLRSCGNLVGFSPTVTITRYAPTVIVVCSAGFWVLHRLSKDTKSKLIANWQVDILAWTAYVFIILGFISVVLKPLCIYILPKRKETISVYKEDNIIPQIFNHVKEMYQGNNDSGDDNKDMPVVYGLGTVYSACYVVVSILISLLVALLLGDRFAPSAVIMYFTVAAILGITSIVQFERASKLSQLLEIPNSSVLCWVLLSHYFFYATGHQPSFPLIQWEAAFVGTGGNFNNNIIPATLIGINSFGSYILMAATLPLLLIGPFAIYIMFPNLASNRNDAKDLRRGELLLYDHDDLMLRGIFNAACKYILFNGLRMFCCMLAVTIHCRHLMVWSIFAPKFIFEGLSTMVSLSVINLTYLLMLRINNRVDKLIISLEKQNR